MSVETLTDSELRTKLSEYGYPAGPVTQTTRKILIKKLKNLMESRGAAGSRHSMAARYSSDDTDDDTSASSKKKKKTPLSTRRQTLANPMPPPAMVSPSIVKSPKRRVTRNLSVEKEAVEHNNAPPSITSRSLKPEKTSGKNSKVANDNDGLETGSDSDAVEESPQPSTPTTFGKSPKKTHSEKTSSTNFPDVNSPKPLDSKWKRSALDYESSPRNNTSSKDDRYSVNLPKSSILDSSRNDSILSKDSSRNDDILANYESPYLSEFTRRLSVQASVNLPSLSKSSLKGPKHRFLGLSSTPELKESDTNGHYNSPLRKTYPSSSSITYVTSSLDKTRDMNKMYKSLNVAQEDVKNNQNLISMVLVVVLALFFIGLAVVYLGLEGKTDNFPLVSSDSNIPICSQGTFDQNKPGFNCIKEENVKDALTLIKHLHPILMKRAISAECDGSKIPAHLSNDEIAEMLSNSEPITPKIRENLKMAHFLLFKNPKWGMSLVDIPEDNSAPQVLDSMERIFESRLEEKLGIKITEPDLPLQCLVRKRILTVFTSLLIAAFGALIMIGCQKLLLAYWQYKKNSEKEVFNLVTEITNMLELHHQNFATSSPGGTQESYLAINHIRDNLIPPKDRRRLSGVWEKAVKYLDENESRIRREVQLVAGEEFQVWRWLPSNASFPSTPGPNATPKMSKVWQGSAFETMEGSVNSLACSPTPCLKIRHMFDPDVEFEEDWETKVKDAILEKCGENVKILHIKVDRGSREGCVYMKCKSQEDAGKAYKALHGSWFDGHLVTVKYLRLERYHERFPEAVAFIVPLKPSNNKRLSMQVPYWSNSSEAN
ncbi:hypothetical protein QAD02_016242 [Eretmocerus hayati]|uniref:Uncharacterized protein n=1 Tax=Eretmocerus hayati TaxID=131215 RepID=A0ACC2PA26_9HYME|nr:hypothetical protein QAD02_016242 [Eretmocerus hayati]